jgi:hypothetical protein
MGYFSTYCASQQALAPVDRRLAAVEVADRARTDVDEAYKAFLVSHTLLGQPAVAATIPFSAAAQWDGVLCELAHKRSLYLAGKKLQVGLVAFLVCGALAGLVVGWNFFVVAFFGVLFGVVVGTVAGSFVRLDRIHQEALAQIDEILLTLPIMVEIGQFVDVDDADHAPFPRALPQVDHHAGLLGVQRDRGLAGPGGEEVLLTHRGAVPHAEVEVEEHGRPPRWSGPITARYCGARRL